MNENPQKPRGQLTVPLSIIIAGALIATAIMWQKPAVNGSNSAAAVNGLDNTIEHSLDPVTAKDHIIGNPNAPIKIVEYSDTSCPYCKMFHPTMRKLMDTYGKSGQLAWVYRHYPIAKLHPNAELESQALECAAELGGNDSFWAYTNRLYEINTAQGQDAKALSNLATFVKLDATAFDKCLLSGKYMPKINDQIASGFKAGVSGTPTSFLVTNQGKEIPIEGAQEYATIKNAIDLLLKSGAAGL